MRTKCGLVNPPIDKPSKQITSLSYYWYMNTDNTMNGQGYNIEKDSKDINYAKRKIRKEIESKPEFSFWI